MNNSCTDFLVDHHRPNAGELDVVSGPQRVALKVQLLDTRRMKELAADHPLMAPALEEREKDLQAQIDALGDEERTGHELKT